jgi:hypothetical protein
VIEYTRREVSQLRKLLTAPLTTGQSQAPQALAPRSAIISLRLTNHWNTSSVIQEIATQAIKMPKFRPTICISDRVPTQKSTRRTRVLCPEQNSSHPMGYVVERSRIAIAEQYREDLDGHRGNGDIHWIAIQVCQKKAVMHIDMMGLTHDPQ